MTIHIETPVVEQKDFKRRFGWAYHFELIRGEYGRSLGLLDEVWDVDNGLSDEGERNVLDQYFRNQNAPPTFYVGLHSGTLVDTSTLANVTEPSQSGYARIEYARGTADWPTLALDAGDYQVTGSTKTFTAAATWTPVNQMILVSQSTGAVGAVLAFADLTVVRSLVSQDQLNCTPKIKAQ